MTTPAGARIWLLAAARYAGQASHTARPGSRAVARLAGWLARVWVVRHILHHHPCAHRSRFGVDEQYHHTFPSGKTPLLSHLDRRDDGCRCARQNIALVRVVHSEIERERWALFMKMLPHSRVVKGIYDIKREFPPAQNPLSPPSVPLQPRQKKRAKKKEALSRVRRAGRLRT